MPHGESEMNRRSVVALDRELGLRSCKCCTQWHTRDAPPGRSAGGRPDGYIYIHTHTYTYVASPIYVLICLTRYSTCMYVCKYIYEPHMS